MRRRYKRLTVLALLGTVGLVALGARFGPATAVALALALPRAERWRPFVAEPAREEIRVPVGERVLAADLYRPHQASGALLLVHGLSPAGRRHPELTRLARLLAREGRLVLVPQFEDLAAIRLGGREIDEVRAALAHLAARSERIGVVGFSFGAGPALLGAADAERLTLAASFGGYADLRHVIAFITTGAHAFGAQRWVQPQQEYNRWKLLSLLVGFVDDPGDRAVLAVLAQARLADPGGRMDIRPDDLGAEGRAVLALVLNRREEAVGSLMQRLSPRARAALEALSPRPAARRLGARLVIAHGQADDSIPFSEALHLAQEAGPSARVVVLRTFHHTGPRSLLASLRDGAGDGFSLIRLADDVLRR